MKGTCVRGQVTEREERGRGTGEFAMKKRAGRRKGGSFWTAILLKPRKPNERAPIKSRQLKAPLQRPPFIQCRERPRLYGCGSAQGKQLNRLQTQFPREKVKIDGIYRVN